MEDALDRFGRYANYAETAGTVGAAVTGAATGLYNAFQLLTPRINEKRAREDFERPRNVRRRLDMTRPMYTSLRRRRVGRRYKRRAYKTRVKRGMSNFDRPRRVVRTTNVPGTYTIGVGTNSVFGVATHNLGEVLTSDLQAAYRLYRLVKVVYTLVPRIDAASSGVANNFTPYVAMACDPEDATAPAGIQNITAYDNSYSKFLPSGHVFKYTCYPKAVNAVGNAGATAYVGSYSTNPWLQLNAAGIAIPHNAVKIGIILGANATVALNYDREVEFHFDVKGLA